MQSGPRFRTLARVALIVPALAPLPLSVYAPCAAAQQVTKPTGTIMTRLPTPGPVVARQLANGTIEVRWKAIAGAARYQVTRSAPPAGARVVATPPDTVYIDANVQAGSQYYYQIAAVDSAGGIGLKSASQPVTATTSATASSLMAGGTTTTGGPTGGTTGATGGTTPPSGPALVAPVKLYVDAQSPNAIVYFGFTQDGMAYRIERGISNTPGVPPTTWSIMQVTGPRPCCWWTFVDRPAVGPSQAVVYRVSTVDPASPSRASAPMTAAAVYPGAPSPFSMNQNNFHIPPVLAFDQALRVGQAGMIGQHPTSLDTTVVAIDARGNAVGRKPGVAWVIIGNFYNSGQPQLMAARVTVTP